MNQLLVAVSVAMLAWLIAVIVRLPAQEIPWLVLTYLFAQFLAGLLGWWARKRYGVTDPQYVPFFFYPLFVALCVAAACAVQFAGALGRWNAAALLWAAVSGSGTAAYVVGCEVARAYKLAHLPRVIAYDLTATAIFASCAIVAFFSLAAPATLTQSLIRLWLAAWWFSAAAYFFTRALGYLNPLLAWATKHTWIPIFTAAVCFAWLAWQLNALQSETSRAPISHPQITHPQITQIPQIQTERWKA